MGSFGIPSCRPVAFPGTLKMTQCVKTPPGASGSSAMTAKDRVPAGAPLQVRGGEMSAPSAVYFAGNVSPALKAALETVNGPDEGATVGTGPVVFAGDDEGTGEGVTVGLATVGDGCAQPEQMMTMAATIVIMTSLLGIHGMTPGHNHFQILKGSPDIFNLLRLRPLTFILFAGHNEHCDIMVANKSGESLIGRPLDLAGLVEYQEGSVVSREVLNKKTGTITIFSFDEGEGLSEHIAPFDATVVILDGEAEITIEGKAASREGRSVHHHAGRQAACPQGDHPVQDAPESMIRSSRL